MWQIVSNHEKFDDAYSNFVSNSVFQNACSICILRIGTYDARQKRMMNLEME